MKEYKYIVMSNSVDLQSMEDYLDCKDKRNKSASKNSFYMDTAAGYSSSGYASYIRSFETLEEAETHAKTEAAKGYKCYVAKLDSYVTKATPPIEVTKYS